MPWCDRAGSTGEFYLMDDEERGRVFDIAVDQAAGRVPVIGCPLGHAHRACGRPDPPGSGCGLCRGDVPDADSTSR